MAVALCCAACTDTTVIGADLVDGGQLPVSYTDSLDVTLTTRVADSNLVNFLTLATVQFAPVGCIESAATGTTNARLGLELIERSGRRLPTTGVAIDSLVLVLPLVPLRQIGDTARATSLRVLKAAAGTIRQTETLTNTPLVDAGTTYGTYDGVVPRQRQVVNTFIGDTIRRDTVAPQLRIRLNQDFRNDIMAALMRSSPTDSVSKDSAFVAAFAGIIIEGVDCRTTLPALSFRGADGRQFGVSVYYTDASGKQQQYWLSTRPVLNNSFSTGYGEARIEYRHDYGNSLTSRLLAGDTGAQDSFAVVQSLNGTVVRVDLPDFAGFGPRKTVTFAQLEVPIAPESFSQIASLQVLGVKVTNSAGDLVDYTARLGSPTGVYSAAEGGELLRIADPRGMVDSVQAYRFNVTKLVQEVIAGERTPQFFLVANGQQVVPGESVLVGPKRGQLRARLQVASVVLP